VSETGQLLSKFGTNIHLHGLKQIAAFNGCDWAAHAYWGLGILRVQLQEMSRKIPDVSFSVLSTIMNDNFLTWHLLVQFVFSKTSWMLQLNETGLLQDGTLDLSDLKIDKQICFGFYSYFLFHLLGLLLMNWQVSMPAFRSIRFSFRKINECNLPFIIS
jgi:hypothetical protein